MLTFTRYLYLKDDVEMSLLTAFLMKNDMEEVYYWAYEYYLSDKEKIWEFIWKLYYDFYALTNPNFYKIIGNNYKSWKKKENFKRIMNVLYTMIHFRGSNYIFKCRMNKKFKTMCKFNKNKNKMSIDFTKDLDIYFYRMMMSIYYFKSNNMVCYLRVNLKKNKKETIRILEKMFKTNFEENEFYGNTFHQLLYFIFNNMKNVVKGKKNNEKITNIWNKLVINYDNNSLKRIKQNNYKNIINTNNNTDISAYKVLEYRRKYEISDKIGCFELDRNNYKDVKEKYFYNWEYFAYNSEIWRERFDKYKIIINNDKECIEFKSDEEKERFYEEYGYEPDEQGLHQHKMVIKDIKNRNIEEWLGELFEKDEYIKLYEKKCKY